MCLIVVSRRGNSWLLAANRDEYHDRPAAAARPWPEQPKIVGGRDLKASGSWLLAESRGRLIALTNYRGTGSVAPGTPSRGSIAREFLEAELDAEDFFASLRQRRQQYAGFNLIIQQAGAWWVYCSVDDSLRQPQASSFAVSNGDPEQIWPKMRWAAEQLSAAHAQAAGCHDAALNALRRSAPFTEGLPDTGIDPALERALSSPFIELSGYGTRCSTLVEGDSTGCRMLHERRFDAHGRTRGECRWTAPDNAGAFWTELGSTAR